jgi:hypothetical protein
MHFNMHFKMHFNMHFKMHVKMNFKMHLLDAFHKTHFKMR